MCGIIGFCGNGSVEQACALYKLYEESKIRGLHAFGVSYYENNKIYTKKWQHFPDSNEFIHLLIGKTKAIIHNRYSTSGDYKNDNNNQPLSTGQVALAINGVISQAPPEEWPKLFNVSCATTNDTEIMLKKLDEDIIEFIKNTTVAAVWLANNNVYALRNTTRPLWHFNYLGAHFVASTYDIINRALGVDYCVPVPPYKILEVAC